MSRTWIKYKGEIEIKHDGKKYKALVDASACHDYEPQTYFEPGCDEIEVDEFKVIELKDDEGNIVSYTDDMEDSVYDALNDFDGWVYPPEKDDLCDPLDCEE